MKIIKGAEVSSFRSLGDTYFARDEKRIYAYGKQLPKAELTSWELLGHWYSRDARRVYYLNREIKGADRDSFTVCTPVDAALLVDHLARDQDHFYQNDEIMEETLWLEPVSYTHLIEAVGHDRTGKDFGYVNILYRYGNKQSCPRPDQCAKMEVMWADESVYGPPAPGLSLIHL